MSFRWGIMGAGSIAGKFAEAVRLLPDCEVAAVASRDADRAEAFARKHQISGVCLGYETLLREVHPDAVYIATRTDAHAALTRLCITHGIPVLCEKAMFTNSADAREILALAREKGVFCMEAMWSRFLPAVREMKRRVEAGEIGEVCYAEFAVGWRAPEDPANRFFDPAKGGGAAYDLTVYSYELADFFLGQPDASLQTSVVWGETGVDVTENVLVTWTNRKPACMAALSGSIVANLDERAVLYGTRGTLYMPRPHMAEGFTLRRADGTVEEWRDEATVNGFVYEAAEVMRCVKAGLPESPTVPHDLTVRCAEMFDAINAAKP